MTVDEARARLRDIRRPTENPGYLAPLADIEIEGWITLLEALKLLEKA